MGSVKSASVGDNRYSRVQGSTAALGSASDNASWGNRRGSTSARATSNDDDDGSGMSWVKRRKEQREKEKKERDENKQSAPEAAQEEQEPVVVAEEETAEHVTQAVTVPAHHAHAHVRPPVERVPSFALRHSMERKGSADTARQEHFTGGAAKDVEIEAVGDMEFSGERDVVVPSPAEVTPRERRESESSANSDSNSSDEDADAEDSVRSEDDDEDAEEEVS